MVHHLDHDRTKSVQVQVTCRITVATKYVEQLRHAQLDVGAAMQHPRVWTVDANGLAIKVSDYPWHQ